MRGLDELADRARRHADDADHWLDLAEALIEAQRERHACEAALRALQMDPEDESAWVRGASIMRRCGENDRAIAAYRRAATSRNASEIGWLESGRLLAEARDEWAANVAFHLAARRAPRSLPAQLELARSHARLGRNLRALEAARRAHELGPEEPEVLEVLSDACRACGSSDEAIRVMEELVERDGARAAALARLAQTLDDEGRSREAAELIETHAGAEPGDPHLRAWLVRTRRHAGRTEQALATARKGVLAHPDHPQLQVELGLTLQAAGEHREACSALSAATRMGSVSVEAWKARARSELALGEREAATRSLLEAAQVAPDDTDVRRRLSELLGSNHPTPASPTDGGLSSDLRFVGVPELLQLLYHRQATGILNITVDSLEVELEFDDGLIVDVIRNARASSDEPTRRLMPPPSDGPSASPTPETRVVDVLLDVVGAQRGSAAFRPDARIREPSTRGAASINPQFAVLEAMRRIDERDR